MRKTKQLELFKAPSREFGGSRTTAHIQRPLSFKRSMHLVLKTDNKPVLFKNRSEIKAILKKQAKNFNVHIYSESVQKDHLHLHLKFPNRESYKKWIRAVTGLIARTIAKGIFKFRPYTRILGGSPKEFWNLNNYIFRNECEVFGIWPYRRALPVETLAAKSWTGIWTTTDQASRKILRRKNLSQRTNIISREFDDINIANKYRWP
jgi:REP element-mobilizing transposase RayT